MPSWSARHRRDQDLDEELGHDFELEVDELVGSGMSREEAERAARRDFGNVLLIKQNTREIWGYGGIERFAQDMRYAFRSLRGNTGFTIMSLLSLALGIGVTTALFSVVYGLLIAPYPFARADEIWSAPVWNTRFTQLGVPARVSQVSEIRGSQAFSDVMAYSGELQLVAGDRPPESVHGMLFSGNAFSFLGVPPLLGRTILPSDINAAGEPAPVAVLSYHLWQRWFGGNPNAIGRTLLLNGRPRSVIGVMPPRFGWWADLWLPLSTFNPDRIVTMNLRLRPGVPRENAQQEWQSLLLRLARENPRYFPAEGFATRLLPGIGRGAGGDIRVALNWLSLVSGFLLLIACANVANLQLARATTRSREIAVRMSVGAGPGRVLRQLLTESVTLSLAGGALGLLLALALIPAIAALVPDFRDLRPDHVSVNANPYVLLFSVLVSLVVGIVCGLAPAVQCSRVSLVAALKDAPRISGTSADNGQVRNLLVIAGVALAVTLLFAGLITFRGFLKVQHAAAGFEPVRVLAVDLPLPFKRYVSYESRIALSGYVLERAQSMPGVQSAAIGNFAGWTSGLSIRGRPAAELHQVQLSLVSADYLRTLGIPLRAGRELTADEVRHGAHVGMINQTALRRLWANGENPIGARVRLDYLQKPDPSFLTPAGGTPEVTIVGVIADTKDDAELGLASRPAILVPYTLLAPASRKLAVRTAGNPMQVLSALRKELQGIDGELLFANPWSVEQPLGSDIAQVRFEMALFGFVGMVGLLLAAAGIYGALHYNVARRTHEIGVRIALGATRRSVVGSILIQGGRLVGIGLALGILGSMVLVRNVEVAGVPKTDPLAIGAVAALLLAAALLACYLPARRAVRLAPLAALRHE